MMIDIAVDAKAMTLTLDFLKVEEMILEMQAELNYANYHFKEGADEENKVRNIVCKRRNFEEGLFQFEGLSIDEAKQKERGHGLSSRVINQVLVGYGN